MTVPLRRTSRASGPGRVVGNAGTPCRRPAAPPESRPPTSGDRPEIGPPETGPGLGLGLGLGRVARHGALNLGGSAVAAVAGVGVTWLAARALSAGSAGVFFAALAAFTLCVNLAKLGTQTGLVYWIARLRALGQHQLLPRCLRLGLTPVVVASLVVTVGIWLAAPAIASVTEAAQADQYTRQLRVLAVFAPLVAMCDTLLTVTRGYQVIKPTVRIDRVLRPLLQVAGFAALAGLVVTGVLPAEVTLFSLAWALPYLPAMALAATANARIVAARTPPTRTPPTRTPAGGVAATGDRRPGAWASWGAREFWMFTGPRAVAGVAQNALQRVDILLVVGLAGFKAAALYTVAGRFVVLGQLANQAISQAVQPRLAALLAEDARDATRVLYQATTAWLVLLTWPVLLLTAVFAPLYLALFGDDYRQGGLVVAVLAGAMLAANACGMVDMVLTMAGRTMWNLGNVGLALTTMIILDLLLVPRLGALGAALGLAGAVLLNNLLPLLQILFTLRVHPLGEATLGAAALALVCFGLFPASVVTIAGVSLTVLFGVATVGGLGYLAACWHLRDVFGLTALRQSRPRAAGGPPARRPPRPAPALVAHETRTDPSR